MKKKDRKKRYKCKDCGCTEYSELCMCPCHNSTGRLGMGPEGGPEEDELCAQKRKKN